MTSILLREQIRLCVCGRGRGIKRIQILNEQNEGKNDCRFSFFIVSSGDDNEIHWLTDDE